MSGRFFGYARVSTDDQNLTLQIDALNHHGIPNSRIFRDKLSGAKHDRPGLIKCLASLTPGDTLVVWRLDRLGRSMRHLITLVEDLRARGVLAQEPPRQICRTRWQEPSRSRLPATGAHHNRPCNWDPSGLGQLRSVASHQLPQTKNGHRAPTLRAAVS